jgi:hypothetical protein
VFLLWAPYLQQDSQATGQRASVYLPDRRVVHFWDLWRFGSRVYADQMGIPPLEAWDMFVFYKPGLLWKDSLPEPTYWLQNRGLKKGTPYNKALLEQELKPWLNP